MNADLDRLIEGLLKVTDRPLLAERSRPTPEIKPPPLSAHLACPPSVRKVIRTANLLERLLEEERRRAPLVRQFGAEVLCFQ